MATAVITDRVPTIEDRTQVRLDDLLGPTISITSEVKTPPYQFTKRVIDILVSLILLSSLVLPMAAIALVIKLTSRGPIFFSPRRAGRRDRWFHILKFRTMKVEADSPVSGSAAKPSGFVETDDFIKTTDDDRLTRVGRFKKDEPGRSSTTHQRIVGGSCPCGSPIAFAGT